MYNGGFGAYPQDDMGVNSYFGESDTNFFGDTSNDSFFGEGAGFAFDSSDSFFGESAEYFYESDDNKKDGSYKNDGQTHAVNPGSEELFERATLKGASTADARDQAAKAKQRGDKTDSMYWSNLARTRQLDSAHATRKAFSARDREKRLEDFGNSHPNKK